MKVSDIIVDKPIQIYSENGQFILIKDNNLKFSLSKINGELKELGEYKNRADPISCYGI